MGTERGRRVLCAANTMKTPSKQRSSRRSGNAMIEFAVSVGVLVPLFIGTFQFGYSFYVYNLLATQIRAGARYASLRTFRCSTAPSITKFKNHVKNVVV